MTLVRLDVVIGVTHDVVLLQPGGALGAVCVLAAAIPDRLALGWQQHALMYVE